MIDPPKLVETSEQQAAVIHLTIPREQIRTVMGPGLREVMAAIAAQGIAATGPWFTHHLRAPGEVFDFEIGVPVAATVTPTGRVKPGRLPAAKVARTVYHGPYESLGGGWGELMAWMDAQHHKPASELWEIYVAGPETEPDASKYRTELNRPLATS
jgi:effector-binding domain-containing protein